MVLESCYTLRYFPVLSTPLSFPTKLLLLELKSWPRTKVLSVHPKA